MRICVAVKVLSLARWHLKGTCSPDPTGWWDLNAARDMQLGMKLVPGARLWFDGGWWCGHQSWGLCFTSLRWDIWYSICWGWLLVHPLMALRYPDPAGIHIWGRSQLYPSPRMGLAVSQDLFSAERFQYIRERAPC